MPLLPVDRLAAVCNAIMVIAWLPWSRQVPWAAWYAATHAAATLLPLLLLRCPASVHPVVRIVREGYPLAWLALVWGELGVRSGLLDIRFDRQLAAWDLALFGRHLSAAWLPAMPAAWFSETMHGAYALYYAMLVGVPLLLLARRSLDVTRELVLALVATYGACFLIYAFFPAEGPLHVMPVFDGVHRGWWWQLTGAIRHAGDSLGTAFPSSHTAGAVALAWVGAARAPRWAGHLLILAALAVALATVYTQNHLVVDTLAGAGIALVASGMLVPWLRGGGGGVRGLREARGERGAALLSS